MTAALAVFTLALPGIAFFGGFSSAANAAPSALAHEALTPGVLGGADEERYRKIFAAQEKGDWKKADALIAALGNRSLLAYVEFQRYMHPTAYRSTYAELRAWLEAYRDHPEADRIHKLALKKRPSGAAKPPRPLAANARRPDAASFAVGHNRPFRGSRSFNKATKKVRSLLRRERPTQSLHYVEKERRQGRLTRAEFDHLRQRIAGSYYIENLDIKALELAEAAAQSSGDAIPLAYWRAGLAAWRLGDAPRAAEHFARLARAESVGEWTRSAGAFWAARAYLASEEPAEVAGMLAIATNTRATFYGLLAARWLGKEESYAWQSSHIDGARLERLRSEPALERAIALWEIGRTDLAERELLHAHGRIDPDLDGDLVALGDRMGLAAAQLHVANRMHVPTMVNGTVELPVGLYPVPAYEPRSGYTIDRALMLALVRQESRFKPAARSYAGAQGLMQIMPRTARHIRKRTGSGSGSLNDPAYNLELGQRYLHELMDYADPRGNLIHLAAAYNGGPGNLQRWLKQVNYQDDPLLFIESIPAAETRGYIEQVLTNLWMYRFRFGQPAPSLDQVASGEWPVYRRLDPQTASQSAQLGTSH